MASVKVSVEMTDGERTRLADKLGRCATCGCTKIEGACEPHMCRMLFVSAEFTRERLARAAGLIP